MKRRLASSLLLLTACGGMYGSDFGATPGGVKDLTLARELIAAGQVPPPDALLVEAMFAEHDLGVNGLACEQLLCLRAAAGIAPDVSGAPTGWVQIGLSSTVDPETWVRPSTTFVMTVDVSGSMGWENDGGTYASAGSVARTLLRSLGDELRPDDRVAIVTYGSDVEVPLGLVAGDDDRYRRVVDGLGTDGSTNMEAGLLRAYDLAEEAALDGTTAQTRVLLFTDVQPNVGATDAGSFENLATMGADRGIGITVLALGTGIGPEVMRGIAHVPYANAFSLMSDEDAGDLMADQWPWFTTPIAFDLHVEVTPATGFSLGELYGFPSGSDEEVPGMTVETVFLSKRKGALLFSLRPDEGTDLSALGANLLLSYRTPSGELFSGTLTPAYDGSPLDERGQHFAQPSTARTVALALLVSEMHEAAVAYGTAPETAAARMRAAHERFAADAAGDETLSAEVPFSQALLDLMAAGAPQGTLYGL
jgi:Ca-activated chloride channel homolog